MSTLDAPFTVTIALGAVSLLIVGLLVVSIGSFRNADKHLRFTIESSRTDSTIAYLIIGLGFAFWGAAAGYFGLALQDPCNNKYTNATSGCPLTPTEYQDDRNTMIEAFVKLTVYTLLTITITIGGLVSYDAHVIFSGEPGALTIFFGMFGSETYKVSEELKKSVKAVAEDVMEPQSGKTVQVVGDGTRIPAIDVIVTFLLIFNVIFDMVFQSGVFLIGQTVDNVRVENIFAYLGKSVLVLVLLWNLSYEWKIDNKMFNETISALSFKVFVPTEPSEDWTGYRHTYVLGKNPGRLYHAPYSAYLMAALTFSEIHTMILFYRAPSQVMTFIILVPFLSWILSFRSSVEYASSHSVVHFLAITGFVYFQTMFVWYTLAGKFPDAPRYMWSSSTTGQEHNTWLSPSPTTVPGGTSLEQLSVTTLMFSIIILTFAFVGLFDFVDTLNRAVECITGPLKQKTT